MKTKICFVIVLILSMILSATFAEEEITVSARVNAELYADQALEEKYGITPVMLDYFSRTVKKTDENLYTIRYTGCEI